jgi:hypothetical protein
MYHVYGIPKENFSTETGAAFDMYLVDGWLSEFVTGNKELLKLKLYA